MLSGSATASANKDFECLKRWYNSALSMDPNIKRLDAKFKEIIVKNNNFY